MELRHLRYFTAVVQWNGYREAARQKNIAQPALSQAVLELEEELGIKLFNREKRRARLTPEGQVFYDEAMIVLGQAEHAMESARRAARGEIGMLRIGFLGSATSSFLPGLIRLYRQRYPGVKLQLDELTPVQQDEAFARGALDVGFTRPLSSDQAATLEARTLYKEPLLVGMPDQIAPKGKMMDLTKLEGMPLVLFHRRGAPGLFDTITALCRKAGFVPRVEYEPNLMQTVMSLVASEAGTTIVPACVSNLRAEGVTFRRIHPDDIRVELVVTWPRGGISVVLRSFLDLLTSECTGTCVTFSTGDMRYSPSRQFGPHFKEFLFLFLNTYPVVEAVGMWESRRDFQRVWEGWEAGFMAFHAFHTLSFPWPGLVSARPSWKASHWPEA